MSIVTPIAHEWKILFWGVKFVEAMSVCSIPEICQKLFKRFMHSLKRTNYIPLRSQWNSLDNSATAFHQGYT